MVELAARDPGVAIWPQAEARRYGRGRVVWDALPVKPATRTRALISRCTEGSILRHRALAATLAQALRLQLPVLALGAADADNPPR